MPKAKPGIDWPEIEVRYRAGESAYALGKCYDVSKQAIHKRARKEGWSQPAKVTKAATNGWLTMDNWSTDLASRDAYSPESAATILENIKQGATFKLAAAAIGIHADTLTDWRKASPNFWRAIEKAQATFALRHVGNIAKAGDKGDWRASDRLLQSHPMTKEDFQDKQSGGVSITFNINRAAPQEIEAAHKVIDAE